MQLRKTRIENPKEHNLTGVSDVLYFLLFTAENEPNLPFKNQKTVCNQLANGFNYV